MSHRKGRKAELRKKREERENVPHGNRERKRRYAVMSETLKFGELTQYSQLRSLFSSCRREFIRLGIDFPDLPNSPTRSEYNEAMAIYSELRSRKARIPESYSVSLESLI